MDTIEAAGYDCKVNSSNVVKKGANGEKDSSDLYKCRFAVVYDEDAVQKPCFKDQVEY